MSEKIVLYNASDLDTYITLDRDEYYAHKRSRYSDYRIGVVDSFIFRPNGSLILQKRSMSAAKSPGKIHTSVGGHINEGEHPSFTLYHETMEEAGVSSYLADTYTAFDQSVEKLHPYIERCILYVHHETKEINERDMLHDWDTEPHDYFDKSHFYFGLSLAKFENLDGKATGFVEYTLSELREAMKNTPHLFTCKMHYLIDLYDEELKRFITKYCNS